MEPLLLDGPIPPNYVYLFNTTWGWVLHCRYCGTGEATSETSLDRFCLNHFHGEDRPRPGDAS